jgi:hypothetical protein
MPGTGAGGDAGPRHGICKPESQPNKEDPRTEAAVKALALRKVRLSTNPPMAFCCLTEGSWQGFKTRADFGIFLADSAVFSAAKNNALHGAAARQS